MISYERLFAAQLREWPNSLRLLPHTVLQWAYGAPNNDQRFQRMAAIAITTQHSRVLFYITDPKGGYIGARFGTDPEQYISGFGFYKVKLDRAMLIDTRDM
jgi:hypothetical protein